MFIYAFIHLHINILKPSRSQGLNSILSQLFCINFSTRIKSSQFTSHSTCFFRYTCIYIYIQYQINILKPLQCPQLQRAQGYVQLAPARKLAWVFVFWLALAQVSWRGGGSHDQFISMHGMFECEQYWNQIYTCVSLRSVIMHSKYRIMLLLPPPLHTCFIYQVSTLFLIYKHALRKIGNTCSCAVFQQQIRSHCHLLRNQSQSCIL